MTGKFGLTLGRLAKGLVAVFVLSIASTGLAAQETAGKIQGTVLDPNGQPVAGAQVFIVGSSLATQTDASGFYFLNNVPSGSYSVRAQFIGLQPAEVQNVRVSGGQTSTVAFDLAGAVALQAISVTVAETPIVPRDQVRSRSIVTGNDVDELPVSDPNSIVLLQPGVVSARGGAISIRGGRANEAAVFIDGAPVRNTRNAGTQLNIATNAVEEVAVTTGAMGAEFGDAQSGVISFVTRAGGPSFSGSLSYETDEIAGDRSTGLNRFEGSLSGPIIGNLTFFIGGSLSGNTGADLRPGAGSVATYALGGVDQTITVPRSGADSAEVDVPLFTQFGGDCADCEGRRRHNSWSTNSRISSKLQFTYGSGSRMSLSAHKDRDQNIFGDALGSESIGGGRTSSELYVFNWVQQVFRGATSELSFDVNLSYQTDFGNTGQIERDWDLAHRDPKLGIVLEDIPFVLDNDHFSNDTGPNAITTLNSDADWDALVMNVRTNQGTLRPYLNRLGLNRNPSTRVNPFGVNGGFNNVGVNWGMALRDETRVVGRANVDWQAGRYNRFRFGGEVRDIRTNEYNAGLTTLGFGNIYVAEPSQASAYASDRLDLGDVVVDFGIRWDKYDTNGLFPRVPGRIFTHPDYDPANPLSSAIWKQGESHTAISPRLGVSFPITDQTGFRLSYAHQAQTPSFNQLFNGSNNDLANTNTNDRFGGDVDFAKTIMFEFGVRHAFSQDMVIDIAAYNKDKVSDHTYRILPFFDPFADRINNVNILTNADFGNIRGVEVTFQRRFSNILSISTNYTFQNAKSTGSDPQDFLGGLSRQPAGVLGTRPEAPQTTLRTRDDRRHNIAGQFTLNFASDYGFALLRNVGVFGTFQVQSGLPYTRLANTGAGNRSNGGLGLVQDTQEPLQSSETPWTKNLNVRINKGFDLGGTSWTLYADIRNVLDLKNRVAVFSETGDIVNEERFRVGFFEPQTNIMRNEALASGWVTSVDINGEAVEAIDLGDGTAGGNQCSAWAGSGGALSCYMLRGAEARFGNGDGVYDFTEQEAAIRGWYNQGNGEHTFLGNGRTIRVGAQLDF
jgi:outer membrane receptor protein involved in Fe transport